MRDAERGLRNGEPSSSGSSSSSTRSNPSTLDPRPSSLDPRLSSLEAEAASQHAVLTAALPPGPPNFGGKEAAEREYCAFMRAYPESPLVHAAVKRIAPFHGGDVPPAAEAVWKQAVRIAADKRKARNWQNALCGPECLAELLRRLPEGTHRRGAEDAEFPEESYRKDAKDAKRGSPRSRRDWAPSR
jgi:hypothetical protein